MKTRLFFGMAVGVAVVAACSSNPSTTLSSSEAANKRAWCETVPLIASAKDDHTRFDNTAARVVPIKSEIQVEALGCGAYYVGVSSAPIMSALIAGQQPPEGPGFIDPSDPAHCIMIYLKTDAPNPVKNPLYYQGVRVYFVNDSIRAAVSAATDQKVNWCKDIPFTSDARTDQTGTLNDENRVKRIVSAAEPLITACPGVTGMAWQLNDTALDGLHGNPIGKGTSGQVAKSWVFRVYVRARADMPKQNPLYLDGVRTYFTLETPDTAYDETAAQNASNAFDMVDAGRADSGLAPNHDAGVEPRRR